MAQMDEQPKVSTFYRVLAWVFVDEALDIEKALKRQVEKRNKSDR